MYVYLEGKSIAFFNDYRYNTRGGDIGRLASSELGLIKVVIMITNYIDDE